MSYSRPPGNSADLRFVAGYARPVASSANLRFGGAPAVPEAVVDFGIAISFDVSAEHDALVPEAAVDFAVPVDVAAQAVHGVSASASFEIGVVAEAVAAHGVVGAAEFDIGVTAMAVAQHPRHVLKGEVRLGGVLVNRLIRAHRLDGGAVVGEVDTVSGRFEISAGWAPAEHYVLALDMSDGATDWAPPTANHLWSVMVED